MSMESGSTSSPSHSSASSSSRRGGTYDVFLSFRGEDTRTNFTDHLYSALIQAGIRTFRDDDELPRGKDIPTQLIKVIEESKMSLVVFSEYYAFSRWCLDELVKIIDCRKRMGQIVIPVFYYVDPLDVFKQRGSFGCAFENHEYRFKEELDRVIEWREALREAANLFGWILNDMENGHEAKFIKRIVKDLSVRLSPNYFNFSQKPVGIESRVKGIADLLTGATKDVCGLHGMAGSAYTSGSSSSSTSSSSSSGHDWTYDVFLSFRGADTRNNFADHLYTALVQAGIRTFRDEDIPRGEEIYQHLHKALQESRISIVVFSKAYASSTYCLEELVKILDCRKMGQIVVPVFYGIDPSDVRKQKGSFTRAFDEHENRFMEEKGRVNTWREALREAASLSGWDVNVSGWDVNVRANRYESEIIKQIVSDLSTRVIPNHFKFSQKPVGIESRVNDIKDLLTVATEDVCIVGLHGMAGSGKTTLAKALFNDLIHGFEKSCFLFNVKEMSEQPNGRVRLQEQFLRRIFKLGKFEQIDDIDRGINMIKERLWEKSVLVVFDDVDQPEQLHELVEVRSWFGPSSIVIITTTNEHLLTQLEVNVKYHVAGLSQDESLELFSWHAFRDTQPEENCVELSNDVVSYCGGHPLALELLGSYLFKRKKPEWESLVDKLQKIPHHQIQKKLRISFEALDDDKVKGIFLDIACFFIGINKEYVAKILDARCGFKSEIAINTLIERSLITIDSKKEIHMHNLLRDMGREIVREMSHKLPGNRSRICFYDDALDVLHNQKGTEFVQGLALDVRASEPVIFNTESFINMRNLKLLQINGASVTGCFKHLSKELLWLCWHECPLRAFPSDFHLGDLVVLDLQNSNLRDLWKEIKILNKLKILDLSYSKFLSRTPNLHSPCLEKLILDGCSSLVEVHQSIGHSKGLVFLNLRGCCRLKNLPQSICELELLETLNITMCLQLETLPERIGDMKCLRELLADGTSITQLPSSIVYLKKLESLSLCGRSYDKQDSPSQSWPSPFSSWFPPRNANSKTLLPVSFGGLTSLRELDISYHGLSDSSTSVDFGSLLSLRKLDLSGNKFLYLPFGIGRIPKLEKLFVVNCSNLLSISELPSTLLLLDARNCTSMESLTVLSNKCALKLRGCQKLVEIHGLEGASDSTSFVHLEDCNNLSNNFKKSLVHALCKGGRDEIFFPADKIPEWFSHCGDGSSLSFHLPALSHGDELEAMIIWLVFAVDERRFLNLYPSVIIKNKSNGIELVERSIYVGNISTSHSWVSHAPFVVCPCAMEHGGELELNVKVEEDALVENCGVHLVVKRADLRDSQGTSYEILDVVRAGTLDKVGLKRGHDHNDEERSSKRLKSHCRPASSYWVTTAEEILQQKMVNYGNFMHGLMKENIQLNRKSLSVISMHKPYGFEALVDISCDTFPGNKNVVHPPRKVDMSTINV